MELCLGGGGFFYIVVALSFFASSTAAKEKPYCDYLCFFSFLKSKKKRNG